MRLALLLGVCLLVPGSAACPPERFGAGPSTPPPSAPAPSSPDADPSTPPAPSALRTSIQAAMRADVPGVSVCVIHAGKLAWCDGFGVADTRSGVAVTPDTAFLLASVTKVFTATALVQLRDDGRLDLDAPVPGDLRHPRSRTPITVRALLTHTAGILDSDAMDDFYTVGGERHAARGRRHVERDHRGPARRHDLRGPRQGAAQRPGVALSSPRTGARSLAIGVRARVTLLVVAAGRVPSSPRGVRVGASPAFAP